MSKEIPAIAEVMLWNCWRCEVGGPAITHDWLLNSGMLVEQSDNSWVFRCNSGPNAALTFDDLIVEVNLTPLLAPSENGKNRTLSRYRARSGLNLPTPSLSPRAQNSHFLYRRLHRRMLSPATAIRQLKGHCIVMSKRIHQSDLPSPDEIVEPLSKLLNFLNQAGDKDEDWRVPQYVAVEKLLSEHPEFIWCIDVAIKEKQHGPMPRFSRAAHPCCDDLRMSIDELKELAATGAGHNDELRYQEARNRLLADLEIAARSPASLRTAISLKAFQEKINLAMGDCGDAVEKSTVIYDEFRHLLEWIQGEMVTYSPEWIALHVWFVKSSLTEIHNKMLHIGRIREAVMANVHPRARSLHWDRFIETEFSAEPFLVRALDIARRTWDTLRLSNTSSKQQQQPTPEQKVRAAKQKTSGRASRR